MVGVGYLFLDHGSGKAGLEFRCGALELRSRRAKENDSSGKTMKLWYL